MFRLLSGFMCVGAHVSMCMFRAALMCVCVCGCGGSEVLPEDLEL